MALSLRNKINLAFAAALTVLLVIAGVSFNSTLQLLDTVEEQTEAQKTITLIQSVLASLNAAEGAHRGFLITGDSAHLPRYTAALSTSERALEELDERSARHPYTTQDVDEFRHLIEDRIAKFDHRLALYQERGLAAVADEIQGDPEDRAIAAKALDIETAIRREVDAHGVTTARWARITLSVIILGVVFAVLFLLIAGLVIHHETGERANAYSELREEQLRTRQLLDNLPLGVFVINARGETVYVNDAARNILGRNIDTAAPADTLAEVYSVYVAGTKDLYPTERLPVLRALRGEHVNVEDVEIERDGARIPLQVIGTPVYSGEGEITAAIAAFTDIGERRQVERIKDELISIVSHELRTPLTSIRGALGLVGSGRLGTLNDQGKRMIDIAINDTDRLVRLINDMLDIERMQSGRIELHKTTCDAAEVVQQALSSVKQIADKANVSIETRVDAPEIWCDSDRIVQTLTNLLGNAIKFSPEGSTVTLSASESGHDVEFRVRDQGRGIPQEKLDTIFERFQQVDASDAREKGGAGLGLAIAHGIVVQHGGRIWAESDGVNGSSFVFTLPRIVTSRDAPRSAAPLALVVEDDKNLASVLAAALESEGLQAAFAASGREAIAKAQQTPPDLMVLDVRLPNRDGFEVVEWLRQHSRLKDMPVVVYTAMELDDAQRGRLSLGPTVFFTKAREKPEQVAQHAAAIVRGSGVKS